MVDIQNNNSPISGAQFEKLFPFHFIINSSMQLIKCGKSMRKLFNFEEGCGFKTYFNVHRPFFSTPTFDDLISCQDILTVLELQGNLNKIKLRGQFEYIELDNTLLFIGTPWFYEISQLPAEGLKIQDFALFDTQLDMLQALNSQESVTADIKLLLTKVNNQKKELQKSAELLKNNQSQLELLSIIAEQTINGVVITDNKGKVEWINKSFTKITGYTIEEIKGKSPGSFLHGPETKKEVAQYMSQRIKDGDEFTSEVVNYHKTGTPYWIKIDCHPIKNSNGDVIKFFALEEDITSRVNTEQALRDAKEKADATSQAKDIFLANMSHEMRTPLNAILGMGNQLKKTKINERQSFFLETMNAAAEHLLVVINDILDISRIESGKLQLEYIDFDIIALINHSVQVLSPKAEEKGLDFKLTIGEGISRIVLGDPYRLNQILLNILNNAIKFTEKGSVYITALSHKDKTNSQQLRFIIEDTGIGIEEGFLDHIFQKFMQEDSSIARKYGGTGLGLNITKQLVELMGGSIKVKSVKNEGTLFLIDIEFQKGNVDNIIIDEKIHLSSSILQNIEVLLVEDNEMNRILAKTILNNFKAITTEAGNGLKALELLKENRFDIILMDIQMPIMGGLEATNLIRNEFKLDIPIIALTANALKGEKDKCIQAGMNAYLSKPFKEDDLISLMAKLLNLEHLELDTHFDETTDTLQQHENIDINTGGNIDENIGENVGENIDEINIPETNSYDLRYLKEAFGNAPDAINSLLEAFIKEGELGVLQLTDYFTRQDTEGLRATAHRLKANMAMLNSHELYNIATEIEAQAQMGIFSEELSFNSLVFKSGLVEIIQKIKSEINHCRPIPAL
jgi:two-component system, sensor histidine kinase